MGRIAKTRDDFESANKYRASVESRLSEVELKELEKEFEKFRTPSGGFDEWAWLRARGAVKKNNAIIMHVEPYDCRPILFEQLQEDLAQYWKWKGRKEWGEKKRLEGLDELAETMRIPPEYKD